MINLLIILTPYLAKYELGKKVLSKCSRWVVNYYGKKLVKDMAFLFRHGNVRQIQECSNMLKEISENDGWEELRVLADNMHQNAEKLILRRIGL